MQSIKTFQTFFDSEQNLFILHDLDYPIEDTTPHQDEFDENVIWRKAGDGKFVGLHIKNATKTMNLTALRYSMAQLIFSQGLVGPLARQAKKENITVKHYTNDE